VRDPVTGAPRVLRLTGADLVAGLYQAFYDSSLIPLLPSVIEALHHGANGIIDALAAQQLPILGAIAEGMNLSVNCADRQRLDDPRRDAAALAARPQYATLVETSFADDCGVWHVRSAPRSFNRPVRSRIPTLVFADEYDPVTPPSDGHRAAATLFRSRVLDLPGLGHAAVFSGSRCPPSIVAAFFVAGDPAVDTSCVAAMPPPNWR
jgi:pimeloyl-ACP methyl ester carboxylesterase